MLPKQKQDLKSITNNTLKILYIGNFDPLSVGENEIAKSFEELGHVVCRKNEFAITLKELEAIVNDFDIILYAKFRSDGFLQIEDFIRRCKKPTVCWVFDLYFGL